MWNSISAWQARAGQVPFEQDELTPESSNESVSVYDEVSRKVDTDKTKINAAETRRVLSEAFKVLARLDTSTMQEVMAKGIAYAARKGQ